MARPTIRTFRSDDHAHVAIMSATGDVVNITARQDGDRLTISLDGHQGPVGSIELSVEGTIPVVATAEDPPPEAGPAL